MPILRLNHVRDRENEKKFLGLQRIGSPLDFLNRRRGLVHVMGGVSGGGDPKTR